MRLSWESEVAPIVSVKEWRSFAPVSSGVPAPDAVAHLGVRHVDMPATPMRVWRAIQQAAPTEQQEGN